MASKNWTGRIRANTYWIGGHTGLGDTSKHHNMRSGIPKGYTAGFDGISKTDIPAGVAIVDMPVLSHTASDAEKKAHWDAFSDHMISGEVVHLVNPTAKSSRKGRSSGSDGSSSGDSTTPTRLFLFEQQICPDPKYWDWSDTRDLQDALYDAFAAKDTKRIGCLIVVRFERKGVTFSEFHIILHDKDVTRNVYDDALQCRVDKKKADHVHVVGRYAKPKALSPDDAGRILGCQPSQIELPKSGSSTFDYKMAYQIHFKDPHKHQYDVDEVITIVGESYRSYYENHRHAWEIGRAKKLSNIEEVTVDVDWLWEECFQGHITRQNIELTDSYRRCYAEHPNKIDAALDSYARFRMSSAVQDFDEGKFKTTFIFIQGPSRMGKSTLAKGLCHALESRYHWQVDDLAATNAMDDYQGGEVILIDDASAAAMTGKAWLNLIDPNNAHPAPGRFKNKPRVAPRVVIVTSTKDPVDFFYFASQIGDRNEALTQFIARISQSAVVLDWRDMRGMYPVIGDDGLPFDAATFNVQIREPRMLEAPETCMVEVKDKGETRQELVEVNAKLMQRTVDDIFAAYTPIGAMVQLVRTIEERNPEATVYGTTDDLRIAMGDMYLAAIAADEAKLGSSNLFLPKDYMRLPDYISQSLTPPDMHRESLAAAKSETEAMRERERMVAELARPTYALHDLPDYGKLADEYRAEFEREASERMHPLRDKASDEYAARQRLLAEAADIEHKAHDEAVRPIVRRRMLSRLSDLADDYFALRCNDEDMRRLRNISDKPRFLSRAVRHWLSIDERSFEFTVRSPLRATGTINSSRTVKARPSDYDILSAFADSYAGFYGDQPYDVDALGVKATRFDEDAVKARADELMSQALAKRAEIKAMEDADSAIVVPEPSRGDVDYYVACHTEHLLTDVDAVEYGVVNDAFFERIELRAVVGISD